MWVYVTSRSCSWPVRGLLGARGGTVIVGAARELLLGIIGPRIDLSVMMDRVRDIDKRQDK